MFSTFAPVQLNMLDTLLVFRISLKNPPPLSLPLLSTDHPDVKQRFMYVWGDFLCLCFFTLRVCLLLFFCFILYCRETFLSPLHL